MTTRQLLPRLLLVAAVALVVAGLAFALSERQEERYEATTRLLFASASPEGQALGYAGDASEPDRRVANTVLTVKSFDIARDTARGLSQYGYTADSVAANVEVIAERGSDVLTIRALAPNPAQASRLATGYRREFTFRTRRIVRRRAARAQDVLEEALERLPPAQRVGERGDVLRSQLGSLEVLRRTGGDTSIIEGVRASAEPVEPQTQRNVIFGALFGALLGVGFVAVLGARSASGRRAEDEAEAEAEELLVLRERPAPPAAVGDGVERD